MDVHRRLMLPILLSCVAAHADSISLAPSADATLIQEPTGEYALGAAYNVYAGRIGDNGGATIRRGLMRFNLGAIPAGSTITSVTLRLYMSQTQSGSQNVGLHRCSLPWTEGTAFAFGGAGTGASACTWPVWSWSARSTRCSTVCRTCGPTRPSSRPPSAG